MNGHLITDSLHLTPEHGKKYCEKCGEATISTCLVCEAEIHGRYTMFSFSEGLGLRIPAYCHDCGNPYPWTVAKIKAAQELAEEIEGLSAGDRELFRKDIEDIAANNPRADVAATRMKRVLKGAGDAVRNIVVDIGSETIKKVILGE